MEKVELLWQQAFSKARFQLHVFQLREDALQVSQWSAVKVPKWPYQYDYQTLFTIRLYSFTLRPISLIWVCLLPGHRTDQNSSSRETPALQNRDRQGCCHGSEAGVRIWGIGLLSCYGVYLVGVFFFSLLWITYSIFSSDIYKSRFLRVLAASFFLQ